MLDEAPVGAVVGTNMENSELSEPDIESHTNGALQDSLQVLDSSEFGGDSFAASQSARPRASRVACCALVVGLAVTSFGAFVLWMITPEAPATEEYAVVIAREDDDCLPCFFVVIFGNTSLGNSSVDKTIEARINTTRLENPGESEKLRPLLEKAYTLIPKRRHRDTIAKFVTYQRTDSRLLKNIQRLLTDSRFQSARQPVSRLYEGDKAFFTWLGAAVFLKWEEKSTQEVSVIDFDGINMHLAHRRMLPVGPECIEGLAWTANRPSPYKLLCMFAKSEPLNLANLLSGFPERFKTWLRKCSRCESEAEPVNGWHTFTRCHTFTKTLLSEKMLNEFDLPTHIETTYLIQREKGFRAISKLGEEGWSHTQETFEKAALAACRAASCDKEALCAEFSFLYYVLNFWKRPIKLRLIQDFEHRKINWVHGLAWSEIWQKI